MCRKLGVIFIITFSLWLTGCTDSVVSEYSKEIKQQGFDYMEIILMHASDDDLKEIRRGVGECIEDSGLVEQKVEDAIEREGTVQLPELTVSIIEMNIATECAQVWTDSADSMVEQRERRDLLNKYSLGVE